MADPGPVERPLHVQVAEALGWTDMADRGDGLWLGVNPETKLRVEVIPYGRSWCSTGSLVDKLGLMVGPERYMSMSEPIGGWTARTTKSPREAQTSEYGANPCEAIARLVVKLHKEGKLVKK